MSAKKAKDNVHGLAESALPTRPSSSEVIKDAKRWYVMKAIQTKRPITPRDTSRVLYGPTPNRNTRPSSNYSIGPQTFDPSDDSSRPGSGTPVIKSRLAPIPSPPSVPIDKEPVMWSTNKSRRSSSATSTKSADEPSNSNVLVRENSDLSRPNPIVGRFSGEGKTEESHDDALYWNKNVLPLLEELEGFLAEQPTRETVAKMCSSCQSLFAVLHSGACFTQMSTRRRKSLLPLMFRLLNVKSRELHILCAKIILEMRTKNTNFTNVCILIFAMCKERKHDALFVKHNLVSSMLSSIQNSDELLTNYEKYKAFVYLTGSLKCLSDNETVARKMYELGCFKILTNFMVSIEKSLKELKDEKRPWEYAQSLMVQMCSAYCNMLNVDQKFQESLESLSLLMQMFQTFLNDYEVVAVISRILSKMTMYNLTFSSFLAHHHWPQLFLSALVKHLKHPGVCIHLTLVLGDLTSHSDIARKDLYFNEYSSVDNLKCLDVLIKLLEYYTDEELPVKPQVAGKSMQEQTLDVLVKVVRVIAHLSMEDTIGPLISLTEECIDLLFFILERYDVAVCEELVINTLAALNNLSYYSDSESFVLQNRVKLAVLLSDLILIDNMSCVSEVIRVFGNLTKFADVRNLLHKHKVSDMMIALLDSGERLIVYNACGVLVNMSADRGKRADIIAEGCTAKLIELIRDFAPTEWRIGGIACQLLWNLSSDPSFVPPESLSQLLNDFTSYSFVNEKMQAIADDNESLNHLRITWKEDFHEFAFPLLNKLKSGHFNLIPLDRPVDSDESNED